MPVLTTIQTAYKWLHSAHWRCRGRWNSGTGHSAWSESTWEL